MSKYDREWADPMEEGSEPEIWLPASLTMDRDSSRKSSSGRVPLKWAEE